MNGPLKLLKSKAVSIELVSFFRFRKEISLLSLLSQGYTVSLVDQEQIIPVLGVFASLFKYALFSVYDTDFYGKDTGNKLFS